MPYDLSSVPTAELYSEIGRRRAALSKGRPPKLLNCPECGRPTNTRERRKHCQCGHKWAKGGDECA